MDVIKILGLCPKQSRRFIQLLSLVVLNLLRLLLLVKVGVLVTILSNQAEVLLKVGILGVDLGLLVLVEVVKACLSLTVGIVRVLVASHLHDGANQPSQMLRLVFMRAAIIPSFIAYMLI